MLSDINTFMNYKKKKLSPKQYLINRQSGRDSLQTDFWMHQNGVLLQNLAVGSIEIFQAAKLANEVLRQYRYLVGADQAVLLLSFLNKAHNPKTRIKITQGQSYKVMNLTKKIKRQAGKVGK